MANQQQKNTLLIIVGFLGVSLAIIGAYAEFRMAGLEGVSILASSFLTLGLLVLYREQHRALRYQQEPHLEVSSIEIHGNLEDFEIEISNFGGGAATSLKLRVELYELDGSGPIETAQGSLRRIEESGNGFRERTRSSSIRPSELNVPFTARSKSVIVLGGSSKGRDSFAKLLSRELRNSRSVLYGKLGIEYATKFSSEETYEADFSLKFTDNGEFAYEPMDFLPWEGEGSGHTPFGA